MTTAAHHREEARRGREADAPHEVPPRGWLDVAARVRIEAKADQVPLVSAGVAFYSLLALMPALIAAVSVYGLVADPDQVRRQVDALAGGLPSAARDLLVEQLRRITDSSDAGLSVAALFGIVVAVWSASSALRHLVEALNRAYDQDESRGVVRLRLMSLGLTAAAVVVVAVSVGLITALPAVADRAGLGDTTRTVLEVLRWPVLALVFLSALALLYRIGPDRDAPKWRWVSWGAALATLAWLVGSALFSAYAGRTSSFDRVYGPLAGVVVLMLWLLLTATVVLLGAELNCELERQTERDSTVDEPRPMGRRGAEAADTVGATREELRHRSQHPTREGDVVSRGP